MGKYGQLEEDEIEMLRKLEITKEEMKLFIRYTIDSSMVTLFLFSN